MTKHQPPATSHQNSLFGPNASGWDGYTDAWATFSDCNLLRWTLGRCWDGGDRRESPGILFIMLNPSTADFRQDDPTIRRCRGFATREGFGSFEAVNLCPWRATDPQEMIDNFELWKPRLDENIEKIGEAVGRTAVHVCAWGAHVDKLRRVAGRDIDLEVLELLEIPQCLGHTKAKQPHPRHPLMVKRDQPLVPVQPWNYGL